MFENDTAENRLKKTFFIVEATSCEQHQLWADYCEESLHPTKRRMKWEQFKNGWGITVGTIDNRPVVISVNWFKIEGELVMFWYACSQAVCHKLIDAWLEKHFKGTYDEGRRASCDASNFHLFVNSLPEQKKHIWVILTKENGMMQSYRYNGSFPVTRKHVKESPQVKENLKGKYILSIT